LHGVVFQKVHLAALRSSPGGETKGYLKQPDWEAKANKACKKENLRNEPNLLAPPLGTAAVVSLRGTQNK
jgi:hypothetical protein